MKTLITIVFLFLINLISNAAIYYIDPSGDDFYGSGTITHPWKSLYKACMVARFKGDTIYVKRGIYDEKQTSVLAPGVSITGDGIYSVITSTVLTSEWTPIISMSSPLITDGNQSISYVNFDGNSLAAQALWISKRNNVEIHHCVFSNFKYLAVYWTGDGGDETAPPANYVTGNKFHDNIVTNSAHFDSYARGALFIGGQEDMLIYNNYISQTGREKGTNGWPVKIWANGGWVKGLKLYDNVLFKDDLTHWDFCIEGLWHQGVEIYNNSITGSIDLNHCSKGDYEYGVFIHDNTLGPEVPSNEYYHGIILEFNQSDLIISRNRFRNCAVGIYHTPRPGNIIMNYEISYNLFENLGKGNYAHYYSGLRFGETENNWSLKNINIFNNVFHGEDHQKPYWGIALNGFEKAEHVTIINNIFINFFANWLISNRAGFIDSLTIKNNIFHNNGQNNEPAFKGTPSNYTIADNKITAPGFHAKGNFHLSPKSPGVRSGLTTTGAGKDLEGIVPGDSPNKGCFENPADLAVPYPVKAFVNNDAPDMMVIEFDMPLLQIIPDISAFNIKVNLKKIKLHSAGIIENAVYIKLEEDIIIKDDLITMAYTVPCENPLKSQAEVVVPGINFLWIKNNVTSEDQATTIE